VGLTTPHNKKLIVMKVEQREKLDRFNDDGRKRSKDIKITLATWNVQTMVKPGKMKEIMEEIGKARVDVMAVQESRWQGQGRIDKDFSLFYSGPKERTGRYGTGFIINAKMRKRSLSFEPLSYRLCKLRLRGKFWNITLISTYAPMEDSPDAIKDEFYDLTYLLTYSMGQSPS
jgi:exonuclease III